MRLHIVTIALDAMPWIAMQLHIFNKLEIDWTWYIAEGVAAPVKDTSWCKSIPARLSNDGTTEFLNGLCYHPRVKLFRRSIWDGKTSMFNAMLQTIKEPGLLLQADSDEIWTPGGIEAACQVLEFSVYNAARFRCTYFLGPNIIAIGDNTYGNRNGEWLRLWKWQPGMLFEKHEPPVLTMPLHCMDLEETGKMGLRFDHYAYALEKQLIFKEVYYGYNGALGHWRRLQVNQTWPTPLKHFFPWVKDEALADLYIK